MNIKLKHKSKITLMVLFIALILIGTMILMPIGNAKAGSWVAGKLNYEGTINTCQYNILVKSDLAYDHKFLLKGFEVKMVGVYCKRNIWTTFTYLINFELLNDKGEVVKEYSSDFKINVASDIEKDANNPIVFSNSSLYEGEYTLKWDGVIKSNATEKCSGSYTFTIM